MLTLDLLAKEKSTDRRLSWILALVLLVPLDRSGSALGAQFEVVGDLVSISSAIGRPSYTNIRPFQVSVHDCQIFIHVKPSPSDRGIEHFEFVTDGTNSSYMVKFATRPSASDVPPKKKIANDSTLLIQPFPHPPVQATPLIPVWFAYGSGCYFLDRVDEFLPPLHRFQGSPLADRAEMVELKADWRQSKEPPFVLEFLADYLSGRVVSGNRSYELPTELATGATNSVFVSETWTNINGFILPLKFTFTEFGVDSQGTSSTKPRSITRGLAKTITPQISSGRFQPTFANSTRVVDYRHVDELREVRHGAPADYITTNKALWAVDKILAEAKVAKNRSQSARQVPTKKVVASLSIAVVVLAPVAFLAIRWWRGVYSKKPNH